MTTQYDQYRNLKADGYVVPKGCMNFREIARQMTKAGYKMNHASARNILYKAMRSILRQAVIEATGESDMNIVKQSVEAIMSDTEMQEALADVLRQAYGGNDAEDE